MHRQICDVVLLEVDIQEFGRQYEQQFGDNMEREEYKNYSRQEGWHI